MEFWGVEVKNGTPLHIDPGVDMLVHISQVALGENKSNVTEPIQLYLTVGQDKLLIGTLSHESFVDEYHLGNCCFALFLTSLTLYLTVTDNKTDAELEAAGYRAAPKSAAKQVNFQLPNEDVKAKQDDEADDSEEESSDDDENSNSEDSGDEEVAAAVGSEEDDEDDSSDDEEDDSSEEETPKKPEEPKKRSAEANSSKNPASNKKAKFVTPQKTETKKPHVHVATPHPSKQGGKNSGGSSIGEKSKQQQTPKSAGAFGCKSCSRTFTSEMGLQSHTKAKHSAAA
ncbi:unnamed protein product [Arabidopsis arenosa]|uniref:C2H2-type domain-containing protein n=1 Tax=Arabidopsis arenosa TaxID=38785 RepID=A0A8S2AHG5_ARAAE|nr:unnamed protein product [Arabidopsis arenosa]